MNLESIKVRNFGPYYGQQSLSFSSSPSRPVVLIYGDNMRGKTSFLNAIRWVLYGEAKDRFGQPIPLTKLVNIDAAESGDWTMSVELVFVVDGTQYELARAIEPKDSDVTPRADADFVEHLQLKRGGHFLTRAEAQTAVNRILPKQIAQFFLFDGEMLYEFETLVANVDKQATAIRESIESILGVPALMNAVADLKSNLKDAEKRQQNLAKKDQAASVHAQRAAVLQAELEAMELALAELQNERDEQHLKQRELNEQLRESSKIEADIDTLQNLEAQIKQLEADEEQLILQKRAYLVDGWRDFVQPRVQNRIAELEREQAVQTSQLEQVGRLRTEIAQLTTMLSTGACPLCGQHHSSAEAEQWAARRASLSEQLENLAFDEQRVVEVTESLRRLRRVPAAGVISAIRVIESDIRRTRVAHYDTDVKKEQVNDRLKNHDQAAISRNRRDYEDITRELGVIDDRIASKQKEIDAKQKDLDEATRQISQKGGPALERSNHEVQLYTDLKHLFQQAINLQRDELRKAVERDASAIFKELTTDKSYQGLRINENYGLSIIDAEGREVAVRSAGAEQVVALSLIGALNRNAVRRGPFVMDSPLGRLDPKHRRNFLKFIPGIADQVTLLVHGGEFDPRSDRDSIISLIDKEYDIAYVSSSQSKLIPAPGLVAARE